MPRTIGQLRHPLIPQREDRSCAARVTVSVNTFAEPAMKEPITKLAVTMFAGSCAKLSGHSVVRYRINCCNHAIVLIDPR